MHYACDAWLAALGGSRKRGRRREIGCLENRASRAPEPRYIRLMKVVGANVGWDRAPELASESQCRLRATPGSRGLSVRGNAAAGAKSGVSKITEHAPSESEPRYPSRFRVGTARAGRAQARAYERLFCVLCPLIASFALDALFGCEGVAHAIRATGPMVTRLALLPDLSAFPSASLCVPLRSCCHHTRSGAGFRRAFALEMHE